MRELLEVVVDSLRGMVEYVFPGSKTDRSSNNLLRNKRQWAVNLTSRNRGLAVTFQPPGGAVQTTISIQMNYEPDEADQTVAQSLVHVFREDLRLVSLVLRDEQHRLWGRLQDTQFDRIIAKFLGAETPSVVEAWLRAVANAMSLTYEGKRVLPCIVFYPNMKRAHTKLGDNLIRFSDEIALSTKSFLAEKWIRAAVEGKRLALVGELESRKIIGFWSPASLEEELDDEESGTPLYAPHQSLRLIQGILGGKGIAMLGSAHGDLFVIPRRSIVFHRTQGRWHYINYAAADAVLRGTVAGRIATDLLRLCIDLSFERSGALVVVMSEPAELGAMVQDTTKSNRPNRILRKTLVNLDIGAVDHRRLITAAATVDGAVILTPAGKVLDVACLVGGEDSGRVPSGDAARPKNPGARTAAAWRASYFGVAVKVSSDGPISVQVNGDVLITIG